MLSRHHIHTFTACVGMLVILHAPPCFSQLQRMQQGTLFYHLSTADGLSDNYINDLCTDRGGNLWIATVEGLNKFNGQTVVKYLYRDYPELQSNVVWELACDRMNRIWVLTDSGRVMLIDEERRFHKLRLYEGDKRIEIKHLLLVQGDIVLLAGPQQYRLAEAGRTLQAGVLTLQHFKLLSITGLEPLFAGTLLQVRSYDRDSYLFLFDRSFCKVNYRTARVEKEVPATHLSLMGKWETGGVLLYDSLKKELRVTDLLTGETIHPFEHVVDQHGEPLRGVVTNAATIQPSQLLLTTAGNGLYLYNLLTRQLVNRRHNAADQATLVNNSPRAIAMDSTRWVRGCRSPSWASPKAGRTLRSRR